MSVNPYAPTIATDAAPHEKPEPISWRLTFLYAVVATPFVAFAIFVPFRVLGSALNTTTWSHSDNYYYTIATVVWPGYSICVALFAGWLGGTYRIRWYFRVFVFFSTFVAMMFAAGTDSYLGLNDDGQDGLFGYTSNVEGFSTPKLSATLILPVYCCGWIISSALTRRRAGG